MLTSLEYKCVNNQTCRVRVRRAFKVRNFRTRTSEKYILSYLCQDGVSIYVLLIYGHLFLKASLINRA
jgi:hypothetical protein